LEPAPSSSWEFRHFAVLEPGCLWPGQGRWQMAQAWLLP
jgi:hypothetical protein